METVRLVLPSLYPKQRDAFFGEFRWGACEASTKAGKTVGALAWLLTEAGRTGKPGRSYWWVARVYPQADIARRRLTAMLRRADRKRLYWRSNEAERWIELANGARIWFKSATDPDNLYGEDVWAVVVDEASRCNPDAWPAIRSTLTATRGPMRAIGNVYGRHNWFYELCRKAQGGAPDSHYAKITAQDAIDAGVLDAAEVEDARSTLPDAVFRELYFCEPTDDGANPFGIKSIRACTAEDLGPGPAVAWGVDLAKKRDWTVLIGLNASGRVCAFERWQSDWAQTTRRIRTAIGDDPALVDSTGVGDPIVEQLQRECTGVEGYQFTAPSRQRLYEGLAAAIQQQEVSFVEQIATELDCFEFVHRKGGGGVIYAAPEGVPDDCAAALGLAVECKRTRGWGGLSLELVSGDGDGPDDDDRW